MITKISNIVKANELEWMNFEARMRKVIAKTLEPVVKQGQTDGKTLFRLDT